jgi:hypothetical protein
MAMLIHRYLLVRYRGGNVWHERFVTLTSADHRHASTVTPDLDHYVETLVDDGAAPDISCFVCLPRRGFAPAGIPEATVYRFRAALSAAEVAAFDAQAPGLFAAEGIPVAGGGGALVAFGGPGLGVGGGGAIAGAVAPAPIAGAGLGGIAPLAGAGLGHGGLGVAAAGVAPLAGVGAGHGVAGAVGGAPGAAAAAAASPDGGLAALAAALNGAGLPPLSPRGSDFRFLPRIQDSSGLYVRTFSEAVKAGVEVEVSDWPLRGPRTTSWVSRFVASGAGNPLLHHNAWAAQVKLAPTDGHLQEHQFLCSLLHTLVTFDQCVAPNLLAAELICRRLQLLEEKFRGRVAGADSESTAFLGGSRQALCICPLLVAHVTSELRADAAVARERRLAREEVDAAKKQGEKNKGKKKEGEE